jgi:uncharacterized membrane protein
LRQLLLWVPREHGAETCERAVEAGASHTLRLPGEAAYGPSELLVLHMPNDRFDGVVAGLEGVDDLRMAFQRDSVVLLEPPAENLPDQVADVSMRGPLEILVEGLQSLGGWIGFLAYSAIAGAVVWAGLVSNTIFLLTAAMLIAPYAAPAMTTALATARGDLHLLRRSVGRYLASVATTAATAAVLTLVTGTTEATHLMIEVANVSAMAVLLPIAAGIAGALNYGESDRTGLVSGAGIGVLVALALAPQAALIGISLVLWEPRILGSAVFVATLQLLGINLAASLVFTWLGVRRDIPRARSGRRVVAAASLLTTAALGVALIGLQAVTHPELTRETVVTRAEAAAMALLDEDPTVIPLESVARYPLGGETRDEVFVLEARVVATGVDAPADGPALAAAVRAELLEQLPETDPRVAITVIGGG